MARSSHSEGERRHDRKDDVIQIRASVGTKALLTRAARTRGQKLSEFMLVSARRQAEEAILDQRTFFLDSDTHEEFLALLDAPVEDPPKSCELSWPARPRGIADAG